FTVTAAQLLAGASGPLLDAFYLNTPLSRQQVVASKAITQTLGHLVKLFYYGLIIGVAEELPGWFFVLAVMLAVAGARSGVALLHRWNDERFRTVSGRVILVIAAVCVARGAYELVAA
ncbi:MAG: sulfite exporter TauE/SafE family protein, partial [Gammaproteobacteria bacterium]|nr:sulfite exporter TauE/SafE family protein [Gammaproteobacteria bacterium]